MFFRPLAHPWTTAIEIKADNYFAQKVGRAFSFLIGIKGQIAQNAESEQRGGTAREEQPLAAGGAQGAGAQPARGEAERQQGQQGREQQQGGVAAPGGGEVARGERAQHPRHPAAGTVQAGESRLAFAKKS